MNHPHMLTSFKPKKIREINFFEPFNLRSSSERKRKIRDFVPNQSKREDFQKYGYSYFDDINYGVGYGGYHYDGRYAECVNKIINYYKLKPGVSVLEIGCAKGFLIYEFYKKGMSIAGIDLSSYAVKNALAETKQFLVQGSCEQLPWKTDSFDLVISKDTLPHLRLEQLPLAISEVERVSRNNNIFLEIGVTNDVHGRELMKTWDETQQSIQSASWWRQLLNSCNFRGQINLKSQF